MKQQEGSLSACCRKHTPLAAFVGPINVLVLVLGFTVVPFSKSAVQAQPACTSLVSTKKSSWPWIFIKTRTILCLHWELGGKECTATIFATSAFLVMEQLSIIEMLLERMSGGFFYVPLKTGLDQPRPGQPWLWLEESWKSLRTEATASLGTCASTTPASWGSFCCLNLILFSHKLLPFPPSFTICNY